MTNYYWPAAWRRQYCNKSYLEVVHDIFGVAYRFAPMFFPTDDEVALAQETKAKIGPRAIGWCLAGSRFNQIYPHSAIAIARLIRETGLPVILFGGPKENEIKLAKDIRHHVEKVNGSVEKLQFAMPSEPDEWPIRRSLTLLRECDLVIAPDTGLACGMAMEDMPKIILLSHASPENITKWWTNTLTLHADQTRVPCHPCHRLIDDASDCLRGDETHAACISSISVESIVATAWRLLTHL